MNLFFTAKAIILDGKCNYFVQLSGFFLSEVWWLAWRQEWCVYRNFRVDSDAFVAGDDLCSSVGLTIKGRDLALLGFGGNKD